MHAHYLGDGCARTRLQRMTERATLRAIRRDGTFHQDPTVQTARLKRQAVGLAFRLLGLAEAEDR